MLLLAGRQLALLVNLAGQVLTVRLLSQSDYGSFAYALALVTPAATLTALGLGRGLARYVPIYQERQEHEKVLGAILLAGGSVLALGLTVITAVLTFRGLFIDRLVENPLASSLLALLIVLAPAQALDTVIHYLFAIFCGSRTIFVRKHVLGPALKLGAVLGLWLVRADVYVLALGYVGGGVLATLISAAFLYHQLSSRPPLRVPLSRIVIPWREILGFSLPLMLSDAAITLRDAATVWSLQWFHSVRAVALFRAVLPISNLNRVVSESFGQLFMPAAARLYARDDRPALEQLYWRTVSWIALLSFPLLAITVSLATPIAALFFGPEYAGAGSVLAVLALGIYVDETVGLNQPVLRVCGCIRFLLVVDLCTSVAMAGLVLVLVPRFGAVGGAGALCIVNVLQAAVYQGALNRHGIARFPAVYARMFGTVGACLVAIRLIQAVTNESFVIGVVLVLLASVAVLALNRQLLDAQAIFPEIGRLPWVGRILGAAARRDTVAAARPPAVSSPSGVVRAQP